jgi:hypothetical protein
MFAGRIGAMWRPITQVRQRVQDALAVSEDGAYMELMAAHEFVLKASTAVLIGLLDAPDAKLAHSLEWTCVRDNGLHRWQQVLAEVTSGAVQKAEYKHYEETHKLLNARDSALTTVYTEKVSSGDWRHDVAERLDLLRRELTVEMAGPGAKPSLRYWFDNLHTLRNWTRGHGLPSVHQRIAAVEPLMEVFDLLVTKLPQFTWPLIYVMPTLGGRAVARPLSDHEPPRHLRLQDLDEGVYVLNDDELAPVRLLTTDRSMDKFYLPNGQYQEATSPQGAKTTYQALCYSADIKTRHEATRWQGERPVLTDSVTAGRRALVGDNNLPPTPPNYVARAALEADLVDTLLNDRDHVVTLMGRGGIGKTTLALHVLHNRLDEDAFANRIWLSARNVDLEDDQRYNRPKPVRRQVASIEEVAFEFCCMVQDAEVSRQDAPRIMQEYVSDRQSLAPLLVVFDNFETVDDPLALYKWIADSFRVPNKALITTRVEDFRGDLKIDVRGMERQEFFQLVDETARRRHISDRIDDAQIEELYRETGGHPYVAQVILAEAERTGNRIRRPRTLMATKDEILGALFGAIYDSLDSDAQRVFLVAAQYGSVIPKWQFEALLLRPGNELRVDVIGALETLCAASLLEVIRVGDESLKDREEFLYTPMAAAAFAERVWRRGTLDFDVRDAIEEDLRAAEIFRPKLTLEQVTNGFGFAFDRFVRTLSGDVVERGGITANESAMLDYVCDHFPAGWAAAAQIYEQLEDSGKAISSLKGYLASYPDAWATWKELARLQRRVGATAVAGRTLLQGALSSPVARDRRARLLEVLGDWFTLVERAVYEPMQARNTARQCVEALNLGTVEYSGSEDALVVRLLVIAQRRDDARKHLRSALLRHPSNTSLQALRTTLFD